MRYVNTVETRTIAGHDLNRRRNFYAVVEKQDNCHASSFYCLPLRWFRPFIHHAQDVPCFDASSPPLPAVLWPHSHAFCGLFLSCRDSRWQIKYGLPAQEPSVTQSLYRYFPIQILQPIPHKSDPKKDPTPHLPLGEPRGGQVPLHWPSPLTTTLNREGGSSLPDFRSPSFYAVSPAADFEAVNLDTLHPDGIFQPRVTGHTARVGTLLRD